MANARLAQVPTIYDAIRLGIVDIEVAPLGTAYDADTSYEKLGTIMPGSYRPDFGREFVNIERGLPKTLIKSFAVGQSGTVGFDLSEITPRAIEIANGGQAAVYTETSATTVSAAPAPTATTFTVAAIGTIVVGSWITVIVGAQKYLRKVKGVAGSAITVDALPAAPVSTAAVAKVSNVQVAGGGIQIVERTMRAIFVDTYDEQFIWHFPKVISTGAVNFNPQDGGSEAILPMEFRLHGVQATVGSNTDLFLWHSYFVPAK